MGEERTIDSRRSFLKACIGVGVGLAALSLLTVVRGLRGRGSLTAAGAPPRAGDLLVFASGPSEGQPIDAERLPPNGPGVLAWAMDPVSKTVKRESPDSAIVLVRAADPTRFSPATRTMSAAGVVAYSAVCTHLCCTVSDWRAAPGGSGAALMCPCHLSFFDPWDGAKVISGPAPRPLPALPLERQGATLSVRSGFVSAVGCARG